MAVPEIALIGKQMCEVLPHFEKKLIIINYDVLTSVLSNFSSSA